MTKERLLDKLAKIKAHAESAEKIGNEEEAHAFATMLQRMLHQNKLEMTDIKFEELDTDEPISEHRIDYLSYPDIELKSARCQWMEQLASIIARAHFCRILVHRGSSRITLVGRQSDAAVAEYMFVTLIRATKRLATKAHGKFYREVLKRDGHTRAASGYKASYIKAFINRLAQRYEEEQNRTVESSSMALVRVRKSDKAVSDYMDELNCREAAALSRNLNFNNDGAQAGRAAADNINLKLNGIAGKASSPRQLQ